MPTTQLDAVLGRIRSPEEIEGCVKLDTLDELSEHFSSLPRKHLHVIVQLPDCELFAFLFRFPISLSYLLIDNHSFAHLITNRSLTHVPCLISFSDSSTSMSFSHGSIFPLALLNIVAASYLLSAIFVSNCTRHLTARLAVFTSTIPCRCFDCRLVADQRIVKRARSDDTGLQTPKKIHTEFTYTQPMGMLRNLLLIAIPDLRLWQKHPCT